MANERQRMYVKRQMAAIRKAIDNNNIEQARRIAADLSDYVDAEFDLLDDE